MPQWQPVGMFPAKVFGPYADNKGRPPRKRAREIAILRELTAAMTSPRSHGAGRGRGVIEKHQTMHSIRIRDFGIWIKTVQGCLILGEGYGKKCSNFVTDVNYPSVILRYREIWNYLINCVDY